MVALINANRTNKSIHQRIDDCRAWRSSGQSYKVRAETCWFAHYPFHFWAAGMFTWCARVVQGEDSIRAFMLSVYTSSASTFFADIKNLIERSIKQMERYVSNTTTRCKLNWAHALMRYCFLCF